jgi:hypothetical protein
VLLGQSKGDVGSARGRWGARMRIADQAVDDAGVEPAAVIRLIICAAFLDRLFATGPSVDLPGAPPSG